VAFETIRGASGVDFVGTAGVDALFSLNETGSITAQGLAGNDTINVANTSGVVGTTTVRGGEGNDVITFQDNDAAAGDAITASRLLNSSVNGGAGDDSISTEGSESTVIRGNENDDNFNIAGNYSNSTINGNVGEDSFTVAGAVVLSNSKFLGGDSNDGLMNFTGAAISSAVESTINGSKGNDSIQMGTITTANGFTIFGGQGNDLITSINAGADGVVYSGDLGDDQITTGDAKDSVSGGDGDDLIQTGGDKDTIDAGAGADIVLDGSGSDTVALGADNDAYTDGGGSDSITGGLGADAYTLNTTSTDDNNYIISAIADSAATLSGTSQGFDTFGASFTADLQHIDITSVGEALLGDAVKGSTTVVTEQDKMSFAKGSDGVANGANDKAINNVGVTQLDPNGNNSVLDAAGDAVTGVATFTATAAVGADTATNPAGVGYNNVAVAVGDEVIMSESGYILGVLDDDALLAANKAVASDFSVASAQVGGLAAVAGYTANNQLAENTAGTKFTNTTKIQTSEILTSSVNTFAKLRSEFATLATGSNGLTASGNAAGGTTNIISYDVVTVDDGTTAAGIDGTYIIVNNTNNILDAGDLMFQVGNGSAYEVNQYGIFSTTETASAWII
jgi:hypothetical protein